MAIEQPKSGRRDPHADRGPAKAPAAATQPGTVSLPDALARRVVVERMQPEIDHGRFPIKRTPGETVDVTATIFADGHDVLVAMLSDRGASAGAAPSADRIGTEWRETPMTLEAPGTDRWRARFA